MASTSTVINSKGLRDAATALEGLIDDKSLAIFREVKEHKLEAGKFDVAMWLEDRVLDRREGIFWHAENLQFIFKELAARLKKIADIYDNADKDGAGALNGNWERLAADELNGWINSVIGKDPPKANQGQAGNNNYDSKDNGKTGLGPGFQVDASGKPVTNSDGTVTVTVPGPGHPNPTDGTTLTNDIVNEVDTFVGKKPGSHDFTTDGGFWSEKDNKVNIKPDAPEN